MNRPVGLGAWREGAATLKLERRLSITLSLTLTVVIAACTAASSTPPSTMPSPRPPTEATTAPVGSGVASPTTDGNVINGLIDIGDERALYLTCRGEGSPTILLEAGDESDIYSWAYVMDELVAQTRTCAYDRAGNGRSVDAMGCRDLDDLLGDLESMLAVARIEGPFLLVGHSGGGFLMAALAARHPADVAGMVLVETPKAITILPPALKAKLACDAPTNFEHRDYVAIEHAVWDDRTRIGDFPMTIISNDYGAAAPENDDVETNVVDQRGWLVLSPNSRQVVVTSGHEVQENEPELVATEILTVLAAARGE